MSRKWDWENGQSLLGLDDPDEWDAPSGVVRWVLGRQRSD